MSAQSKVSVAVVGCGGMARAVHHPSLRSFDDVEVVGICDLVPDLLHAIGDDFGISRERRFDDYRQMLQQVKPDGVYVIGQPHLMYDIWSWCLEQKLNLYIEKPLGLTIHQARSLAYLAQENGCITQVSHQRRSAPLLRHLREAGADRPRGGGVLQVRDQSGAGPPRPHAWSGGRSCKRIDVPDINWTGWWSSTSARSIRSWAPATT